MGGIGSGRREGAKTAVVLFALDVQIALTGLLHKIEHDNASFDEVALKIVEINRKARRICEENERLK